MGSCIVQKKSNPNNKQHKKIQSGLAIPESNNRIGKEKDKDKKYQIRYDEFNKIIIFENAPLINSQYLYNKFHHDNSRPEEINMQWQIEDVKVNNSLLQVRIINRLPVNLWVIAGGRQTKTMTGLYLQIKKSSFHELLQIKSVSSPQNPSLHEIKLPPNITEPLYLIMQSVSNPQQSLWMINKYDISNQNAKLVKQQMMWNSLAFELGNIYNQDQQNLVAEGEDPQQIQCVICSLQPSTCILVPCKHMCMCKECVISFKKVSNSCPLCKQHYTQIIVYKQVKK